VVAGHGDGGRTVGSFTPRRLGGVFEFGRNASFVASPLKTTWSNPPARTSAIIASTIRGACLNRCPRPRNRTLTYPSNFLLNTSRTRNPSGWAVR